MQNLEKGLISNVSKQNFGRKSRQMIMIRQYTEQDT